MTIKLVQENTFFMTEAEVRKAYKYGKVGIHYAFNNYGHDVSHVLALREEVLKDYPSMSDKDMEVWTLSRDETIRHASFTTLFVGIPIEDYLKLRKEGAFEIR